MSDQIQPAPRAPQPTTTTTSATTGTPIAGPSHANFSRPGTATNATAPTLAAPAVATDAVHPSATTIPPPAANTTAPATEQPSTFNARLNDADRYWKFKGVLQLVLIITGFIGIGTIGWTISTSPNYGFTYGYESFWGLWPMLVTFTISIVWCLACILVLVFRKKPAHPGLRVAMDLLLWLGFIVTILFAMVALLELRSWGEYGDLGFGYSSSYGDYELADNGTWVWERDSDYVTRARDCDRNSTSSSSSRYYYEMPPFANCAEQDAYINDLWKQKPFRYSVELTGVVCQYFGLVLHLALFIWACIDCHRYNRSKVSKDAEKIAAGIVQTMITNGAVMPPPGQAYMRPAAPWGQPGVGYYQLPPQGQQQAYPMAAMYPQGAPGQAMPQQYHAPGGMTGPGAGPSNEKSVGPRYA